MKAVMMWCILLCAAPVVLVGCGASSGVGDLDALTEDLDGNGFFDVTPPEGVEFLSLNNVRVRLHNTIDGADLGSLAAEFGVDPALLNLVDLAANITIDLDYGGGITDALVQQESINPFDRKFEMACPDAIGVDVNVSAQIPLVGPQDVTDFDVDLAEGVEYTCGQTIEVEVFVNERGDPDVAVTIE